MIILFIRHGETNYNFEHRIQGQCDRSTKSDIKDMPLNSSGKEQVKNSIKIINATKIKPEAVLSSPLLRAKETAQIISQHFSIPVFYENGLKEMFFGDDWEGMILKEFKAFKFVPPLIYKTKVTGTNVNIKNGEELRFFHKKTDEDFDNLAHPGGETKLEVRKRFKKTILDFISSNSFNCICVPTHNAALRFFVSEFAPEAVQRSVKTGEILAVRYDGDFSLTQADSES